MFDLMDFGEILTPNKTTRDSTFKKLTLSQIKFPSVPPCEQINNLQIQDSTSVLHNNKLSILPSSQHPSSSFNKVKCDKNRNYLEAHQSSQCETKTTHKNHSTETLNLGSTLNQENVDLKEDREKLLKRDDDNKSITVPTVRVRKLSELQECNTESVKLENVIELSSENDDENDVKSNVNRKITKCHKGVKSNERAKTTTKKRTIKRGKLSNDETDAFDDEEIKTPAKRPRARKAITEEKITVKRTLTKSTNLKTFPAKFLPENQKRIDNFFKVVPDPNKIGYFDTFPKSKPSDLTEGCAMDYLDVVRDDLKKMKATGGAALELIGIVDLVTDEEEEEHNLNDVEMAINKAETKEACKTSIKIERISQEENIKTESSICQYYSHRKISSQHLKKSSPIKVKQNNGAQLNMVTIPTTNLNGIISDDETSSIIFNYKNVPVEKAESVDYTPPKVRQKIEASRRRANKYSSVSSNSIAADVENDRPKRSFRKRLNFKTNQTPEKILIECSNLNGIKMNVNLNAKCSVRSNGDRAVPGPSTSGFSRKRALSITSSSSSSRFKCVTKSVMFNEKIDLTLDITPDKNSIITSKSAVKCTASINVKKTNKNKSKSTGKRPKRNIKCPDYKIIEGTSFAVDAFRFGDIEGVSHYFLTHFHADHYIGLKKSFDKPIFLSAITARLVEAFIHTNRKYLNVMKLNEPIMVKDIEVTALDANHCPGAVMFLFKFPNGMCTLHTGDFRACPEMEMEPVFWNNMIYTIYLDTTYLSRKYAFMSQTESIEKVVDAVETFKTDINIGKRVLYICGSYVIGKEKVWLKMAEENHFKVWTDGNRRIALKVIGDKRILDLLVDDPTAANVHILSLGQLSYDYLSEYLNRYSDHFDVILAIRPSGWERNSKPQMRGRINIIGIEYSEHSSYDELRRFVRFLTPRKLISTVPSGGDLSKTNKIPNNWLNNSVRHWTKGYQQSITNFFKINDSRRKKSDKEVECAVFIDSPECNKRMHAESRIISQKNQYVSKWLENSVIPSLQKYGRRTNCTETSATLARKGGAISVNNQITTGNEVEGVNSISVCKDFNMANIIRTVSERIPDISKKNILPKSNVNNDKSGQAPSEPSASSDWLP